MPKAIPHQPPPKDLEYKTALHEEHHLLEQVDLPIITLSSTHRQGLAQEFYESFPEGEEIIYSRAHYSMALAVLVAAYQAGYTAWLSDPMNYVTSENWNKVVFTQTVGRLMARHQPLRKLKDLIDTQARNKLPITDPITPPLQYLTQKVKKPIISLHYETGRILAQSGHQLVQVITDPHVRPQYLDLLPNQNPTFYSKNPNTKHQIQNTIFCVFDEPTKTELLLIAKELNKHLNPNQVIVTGPPVDPRIISCRDKKLSQQLTVNRHQPLRLALTTGGIGSNKAEIAEILKQLTHFCFSGKKSCAQLFLYAGCHKDFYALYQSFIESAGLKLGKLEDENAQVRILYSNSIVDANEKLIQYMFPWADGIITKPSGDMAYDAAAAGCFTLFLEPLGPWEENIQARFLDLGIGADLEVGYFQQELEKFSQTFWQGQSWFAQARNKLTNLPAIYLSGATNIVNAAFNYPTSLPSQN